MKLCVDNNWLRRQIVNDPIADADAGRVIRCSADVVAAPETVPVSLPWLNRLSSVIDQMADWTRLAERYLTLGLGNVGTVKGAEAATMKGPTKASTDHRSWKQGEICLTLSVAKSKPFPVTLRIEGGPVVNIARLMWVDMGSIGSDPLQPPVIRRFYVTPASDERTFRVVAPGAEISRRLGAIIATEKEGTHDARLLLPFVEWD